MLDKQRSYLWEGAVLRYLSETTHKRYHEGVKARLRWHDLRHAWASWHVQNGTSLQELMELGE